MITVKQAKEMLPYKGVLEGLSKKILIAYLKDINKYNSKCSYSVYYMKFDEHFLHIQGDEQFDRCGDYFYEDFDYKIPMKLVNSIIEKTIKKW